MEEEGQEDRIEHPAGSRRGRQHRGTLGVWMEAVWATEER